MKTTLLQEESLALRGLEPPTAKVKKGLTLTGIGLAALGLPVILLAFRIIAGVFQYILAATGVAFVLGFFGYLRFKRRRTDE